MNTSTEILINPDELIKSGWKKMGNAWYGPANKALTNYEHEWQLWKNGISITVTTMDEL